MPAPSPTRKPNRKAPRRSPLRRFLFALFGWGAALALLAVLGTALAVALSMASLPAGPSSRGRELINPTV